MAREKSHDRAPCKVVEFKDPEIIGE